MSEETAHINHINETDFKDLVLEADRPVVVDFWAPWCTPCHMIAPILEKVATEYGERIQVVKVNTDENRDLAIQYNVRGIPTLLFFREGQEVGRIVGLVPEGQIRQRVEIALMLQ